ncbi:hypothetical protein CK203_062409 [Vitis vinifera]|uniref:Reverse transcriptase domain-containing protein n=1 Tax=Vitis vinifera TaxID=29760 RepID=A0A438FPZ2_VITVI|nr:hypothetical protein CK203_062409 [Vitis vinifera]
MGKRRDCNSKFFTKWLMADKIGNLSSFWRMKRVLIANEIVDEKRRSGEEGVVFKIDFEKAYDHDVESRGKKYVGGLYCSRNRTRVNLDKSNLYGINLDQDHLSRLALLLDCKVSDWPILYLGLPLGRNPKACGFWIQ